MKFIYAFILVFAISASSMAQDLRFSYVVDASVATAVKIDIFARASGADETLIGYTTVFYYNSAEAAFVSYDDSPAVALGWVTAGNTTVTNQIGTASNGGVPSVHDSRLEVQQFDGNFVGSLIGGTPVLLGSLTFDRTAAGSPNDGGDAFISDAVLDPGIQYVDGGFAGHNIVTEGTQQQALPIELKAFDVVKRGEDEARLTWTTASEQNVSHFDVERSVDGKSWDKIGMVNAVGQSMTTQTYGYDDSNLKAIPNNDRVVYYRLRAVDMDSKYDFSEVKFIELDFDAVTYTVYPNPALEALWIRVTQPYDQREELTYSLVDISGKVMRSGSLGNAMNINQQINFGDEMATGTYILNVTSPIRSLFTERIVVVGEK